MLQNGLTILQAPITTVEFPSTSTLNNPISMKDFICDYCKEKRPCDGRRRLVDFDRSPLYYCKTCMDNPMARRRMKVVAKKHDKAFWAAFYNQFS
ncbi:MAG: hypothetical protein KZQ89_02975 [Candidatus Thiodiazotropha sp. (ex Lucinoma kastoroae)]|nr:hypothetical protein [Candidatus Thiodiazotropha sp. (ex Lucinoma kastoroae)]